MKCTFIFRNRTYLSPSKKEARRFTAFYNERSEPRRLKTTWKIKHVENGPDWAPIWIDMGSKIEYGKV